MPLAVPPLLTYCTPPLLITAPLALAVVPTYCAPPLSTVELISVPRAAFSTPPLLTMEAETIAPP